MAPASPAAAIAWGFRQRHRWGLIALGSYLVVLGTIKYTLAISGRAVQIEGDVGLALTVVVPMTAAFVYLLVIFTFGHSGRLAARPSIYPARMFTLPVSNVALAGWPMLYGTLTAAGTWVAIRLFVIWPSWLDVPVFWPALLAAALLAWTQALVWMPYGLSGVRVVVTMVLLVVIDTVVILGVHFKASEAMMAAILAPQVPLAYVVAWFAVTRARQGVVPDWRGAFSWLGGIVGVGGRPRRHGRWRSAARAQRWFEWRRHGWSLPVLVGILLPFELLLLFAARDAPVLIFVILLGVVLTPPFMAAFVAASVRRSSASWTDAYGLSPFIATRPLTGAALVAAKLRTTLHSTLVAWLLVVVAIPIGLVLSDTWPTVLEQSRRAVTSIGTARAIALPALIVIASVASTWKQLVQTLYLGLTGRAWIVKASLILALALLCVLGPVVDWIAGDWRAQAAIWDAIPGVLMVLVGVKMGMAGWIAARLYRGRLLSDRTLVVGAASWAMAVFLLYGVFAWFLSSSFSPDYLLLLTAILATPLVRLSATPLALAWSRHR